MNPLELTKQLICKASVTPEDQGCQALIGDTLKSIGFTLTPYPFGEVSNLWASYGTSGPIVCFAGHTDVVPPGPLEAWDTPPFEPTIKDGMLYGRGAADMKSGLSAMICAASQFIEANPTFNGTIAFLITSDEEGDAINGTDKVMQALNAAGVHIDYCIIGEASCDKTLGDTVRIGRRGSLNGRLTVNGKQGHIAYPQLADNPIHKIAPFIHDVTGISWDNGNDNFPATSFQISNIHAGTGASNVIPGDCVIDFNWRYSPESTADSLKERFIDTVKAHQLDYDIRWKRPNHPFYTPPTAKLIAAASESIQDKLGVTPELSTGGGTSDGRFIAPYGTEVIELGPINASIHKINEHVFIEDLQRLTDTYEAILKKLLL